LHQLRVVLSHFLEQFDSLQPKNKRDNLPLVKFFQLKSIEQLKV